MLPTRFRPLLVLAAGAWLGLVLVPRGNSLLGGGAVAVCSLVAGVAFVTRSARNPD